MYFIQHNDIRSISGVWYYGVGSNDRDYIVTYLDGSVYIGNFDFNNVRPHGQGIIKFSNGDFFRGNFENGLRNGQGTLEFSDGGVFHGNWKNGKRHGQGTLTHSDGRVDEGIWKNGKFISVSYNNMF